MTEYIERAALKYINYTDEIQLHGVVYVPLKDVLRGAEKIPAEDVAKVVRCKDCRYNDGGRKCLYPDSIIAVPDDDDFCSYGKERGEEEDLGVRGALIERVARVLLDRQMFWCGKECRHNNGQITCMDCTEVWLWNETKGRRAAEDV